MQEFSDSKNGNTDIKLLLYGNQPPQSLPSEKTERGRSGASRPPVKLLPVNHHHVHPTLSQQEYASSDSSSRWGGRDWLYLIEQLVPAVRWLRTYDVDNYLKADLIAGITVGTMVVPQAMSYARLAGLHPIYGLYSEFVPVFAYAIFGSSRQLAIGPVVLVSLLISNALTPLVDLAEEGADVKYTQLCILLALMTRVAGPLHQPFHYFRVYISLSNNYCVLTSQELSGIQHYEKQQIVPLIESIYAGRSQGKTFKHLRFFRAAGPVTAIFCSTVFVKLVHPSSISGIFSQPPFLT
ncbi:hypothetical protein BDL97_01G044000 [Sphagnum fallax]|nr:hypothetical protein BDL97_01G044000 [Sphagnum fallax]